MWNAMGERNLDLIAAGVAFFALLAIFPGIAALISIWGFMSDPAMIEYQFEMLREFIPEEAHALVASQIDRLAAAHDSALGWTTLVSILFTLWTARLGVGALMTGLNAVHGLNNRGGVRRTAVAIALTVTLLAVAIVAIATIIVLPIVLAFVPLGPFASIVVNSLKWIVALSVVMGGLSIVYRYGPNRGVRLPWLTPGLLLAVSLWALASLAFSWFLANFGNYNETYGSLAAVVALLIWFYISAYATLIGALLNAELEGGRLDTAEADNDAAAD
ncbi:YihY/virulence factor BrkB family protein [Alkalilacustris brevis]|uniref:YihY/virulence factor BrkB family protein n=1 Tax=Alkalilacustris brevis TaxID=2026338 RepID=UPI0023675E8E|nr:YihY/virulence factor BrkB family protein [Alkalilacustris brevis]